MMKWIRNLALPAMALGLALFALYHLIFAEEKLPKLNPPITPASSMSLHVVAGVGMVEPASESIAVGASQSGIALEVYYTADKVGQRIKKGEPLLKVDDRSLRAQLEVNRANLRAAEAEVVKLDLQPRPEDLPPLEAKVKAAKSRAGDQEKRLRRAEQLTDAAIAREEVTQRRYAYETAVAELEEVETELAKVKSGAWKPDLEIARSNVEIAKANVAWTESEIDRCLVRAPLDAEILQVNARVGEYVSGASARSLFVLGDLDRLHLRVDIDEEDIPRFKPTAPARAVLRGDAGKSYELKFLHVEPNIVPKKMLSGENTERVDTRVLQAVYEIQSPDSSVFVGQQLDVFLEIQKPEKSR